MRGVGSTGLRSHFRNHLFKMMQMLEEEQSRQEPKVSNYAREESKEASVGSGLNKGEIMGDGVKEVTGGIM